MEVTVTLKASGDYDAPWIVFRGLPDELIPELAKLAGLEGDTAENLGLDAATVEAAAAFRAAESIRRTLGGTLIGAERAGLGKGNVKPAPVAGGSQKGAQGLPEASGGMVEVTSTDSVVKEVGAATSARELREIWADRQADLDEDGKAKVKEAIKARNTELKKD